MGFGIEVANALAIMRNEKKEYMDYLPFEAVMAGEKMVKSTQGLWGEVLDTVVNMVRDEIPYEYPHVAVWWYSVLIGMKKDSLIFNEFIRYVRKNKDTFSGNTQYFLFYQLESLRFDFKELDSLDSKEDLWHFYMEIVSKFAKDIHIPLEIIPPKERDENLVIVITEQFLDTGSGPAKTALDRCRALITKLGKKVLLINNAECLTTVGMIPFYNIMKGQYLQEKMSENEQHWKGVAIPYYQCRNNMPNVETMNQLLEDIRTMAPERIVLIGKGGVLGNLAGRMVPSLTVGLGPSELGFTCTKYQTLGRKLEKQDVELLEHMGYSENHVIESVFTSSLKSQTESITRKELGVPDDSFLMVVVGLRLDTDVTDEFLQMLEEVMQKDMYLVFLGIFNSYKERIEKFLQLKDHSVYPGECQDILSRMELCDLYINPTRKGGGTSCVEAMFKGVPVVTVNYGDVSVNVGKDFCVMDYAEMQDKILQYYKDKEFYKSMSEKALERAEVLLDTETEFLRIMAEVDRRELESCQQKED